MSDAETFYENALNTVDAIHNEGFYFLVTQADENEWARDVEALRAVGLVKHAELFADFIKSDGGALKTQSLHPPGSSGFEPSKDWDVEFAAILDQRAAEGEASVEAILEDYRLRHGLKEL